MSGTGSVDTVHPMEFESEREKDAVREIYRCPTTFELDRGDVGYGRTEYERKRTTE